MAISRRKFLLTTTTAAAAVAGSTLVFSANRSAVGSSSGRRITLLHMADTHAQIEAHPEYMPGEQPEIQQMGGLARLKTAIDRERAKAEAATFLVDSGDAVQGSGPAAWSEGEVVIDPLNALGLDAFVPGNWEPVYGPERLKYLMGKLKAPVIAYNFHDKATGDRLFAPSVTIERGGVRVMFVGLADPTTTVRQPPVQVKGLDSTRMEGLREFIQEARKREKPDLVVAVTHTGLTVSRQIAREIPDFDVILSGHTHERTSDSITEGKVIVVEPGSLGSFLGRLDITLGENGGVVEHSFRLIPVRANDYAEDPTVKGLVAASLAPFRERMNEVVGETKHLLMRYDVLETNTDFFVADVVRKMTGADIGFTNGFRFGPPIPPGPVTVGDLWNMLPLDSRMKVGWIMGKQLRDYLENELELVFSKDAWTLSGGWGPRPAGMTMVITSKNPKGKRLVSLKVNDREVKDDDRITIAGCERDGEPLDVVCRLRGVHDVRYAPQSIHKAMLAYLKKNPVITAQRSGRCTATDLPGTVFSQDAVLTGSTNAVPPAIRRA
ncbi:bifunctional metallophosphatase/5'-nucleotidase [Verrucomicrobiota bacterium sgz303538]